MDTVSIPPEQHDSSRKIKLVVILALVFVGVLVFRFQSRKKIAASPSATVSPTQVASTAPSESTPEVQFDPDSVKVDLTHLWTANPFIEKATVDQTSQNQSGITSSTDLVDDIDAINDPSISEIPVQGHLGDLRVSATFDNGREPAAIIGSQIRRQGDRINDTFRIVAIYPDRVEVAAWPSEKPAQIETP
ncbi:hypothetical protein [Thalassoroseus pseudoceratinae]|uniref:hypothetical protein n=1 Tax=Thalassoroseus pseudoceratinae TaxID=2713176 RepID=UPI00141E6111|nr:hypothetical protein [Thalassoroseus pseudoceratinae]